MPGVESVEEMRLVRVQLEAGGNFTGSRITGGLLLRGASVADSTNIADRPGVSVLDFADSTVDRLQIAPDIQTELEVGLRDATVRSGRFSSPDGLLTYDLRRTTVGDVTLEGSFGAYRTSETTFDGFDFTKASNCAPLFDAEWRVAPDTDGTLDPVTAESTYLKCKNGAAEAGADRVAAELFRREQIARREVYASRIRNTGADGDAVAVPGRLRSAGAWIANFTLGATTGHGERPSRVVVTSVGIVMSFALLYRLVWAGPHPYGHWSGYLLLSIESFVTLVLGGAADISNPWWLRFIAEVEGFLGVFLVALFVFTLTRSVNR